MEPASPQTATEGQPSDQPKTAYELQQDIQNSQEAYADAQAAADQAAQEVEAHQQRIAEIEKKIPAQERRTAQATRELYKLQQQGAGIVDMLLSSGSFEQFLRQLEYVSRANEANYAEINQLYALKQELSDTEDQLRQSQSQADARVEETQQVLEGALEAQAEAQRRLEEEARLAAEAAANAAALAASPRDNAQVAPAEDVNSGTASNEAAPPAAEAPQDPTPETPAEPAAPDPEPDPAPAPDVPAATDDEASFVAEWAPRIDAYLNGSPLADQGATFARAAYAYGVDPRFSPAISCTESGKGSACFLPHNAWGWGSASWDTWEEAIDDHVRGLSIGYGHTITVEGAKKYCPPNWKHWYNTTRSQMELI